MPESSVPGGAAADASVNDLVISRVFAAPRERVWQAWTDPNQLARWWGPAGATITTCTVDLRRGGRFHYCMRAPDGQEMWGKFIYREIAAPERLVFVSSFSDPQGNTVRAPFSESFPLEILNTLTLTEQGDKTELTLQGGPINATDAERQFFLGMQDGMQEGFAGTFQQLEDFLTASVQNHTD